MVFYLVEYKTDFTPLLNKPLQFKAHG